MHRGLTFASSRLKVLILGAAFAAAPTFSNAQPAEAVNSSARPERAFIANGGGDFGPYPQNVPEGASAERAYNEFFAGMSNWGRYEIVADPANADWIFEITAGSQTACVSDPKRSYIDDSPRIEVVMMDKATWGTRKTFFQTIQPIRLFRTADHNFDAAIAALIDQIKNEIGVPKSQTSLAHPATAEAPVPPQISSAKKVFIRAVSGAAPRQEKYTGGTAVYDQLLAAMKSWGRYTIVPYAAEADLVLDLTLYMQPGCAKVGMPQLSLAIQDARTQVRLWGISIQVNEAIFTENARKNFARAMTTLVAQFREVAERPTWASDASAPASAAAQVPTSIGQGAAAALRAAAASQPAGAVPVIISTPASVVKSGAPVQVEVTLKNSSKQDIAFVYPSGDPLACMILVRDGNGNSVVDTEQGQKLKAAHAAWQGRPITYTLQPGETQTRGCAVSELYDMRLPGKYSIEVHQLDGSAVASNAVTVTVVP